MSAFSPRIKRFQHGLNSFNLPLHRHTWWVVRTPVSSMNRCTPRPHRQLGGLKLPSSRLSVPEMRSRFHCDSPSADCASWHVPPVDCDRERRGAERG